MKEHDIVKIKIEGVDFIMIYTSGGSFIMGSSEDTEFEFPPHEVYLSSYFISEYVNLQQLSLIYPQYGNEITWFSGTSHYECEDYIKKLNLKYGLNFRLQTEAQFEYALRKNIISISDVAEHCADEFHLYSSEKSVDPCYIDISSDYPLDKREYVIRGIPGVAMSVSGMYISQTRRWRRYNNSFDPRHDNPEYFRMSMSRDDLLKLKKYPKSNVEVLLC